MIERSMSSPGDLLADLSAPGGGEPSAPAATRARPVPVARRGRWRPRCVWIRWLAYCRKLVLEHNPQHLIRRWPTMQQALLDEEFLCFLRQLRRRYPQEKAEQLLQSLDIDAENERRAYYSDYEYAAALLGTTTEALDKEEASSVDESLLA